jgi:hypothetical protein
MSNPITFTMFQNVALAISAYADEMYTNAKKLNGTEIVSTDARIDPTGESFIGQLRWYKPLSANINVASLTNAAAGQYTDISTEIADYIKTVRTFGAKQVNLQQIVSQQDGLAKIARDFTEVRAQDESDAVVACMKGVAAAEVARGAGVTDFDTNADAADKGLFVDINANSIFGSAAATAGAARKLIDASATGAARGERLFKAIGMAFKDYEPDFMYMVTSPEVLAELRASNLVDDTIVTEGNLQFQTIFGGKFRLLLSRVAQGNLSASANVNEFSTKTTFLVKPGSISFTNIVVPTPVEIERAAAAYTGGGSTDIWYRYGFVVHPMGYDWAGATNAFASNSAYATGASWARKMDSLNLGILPILHA